MGFEVGLGAGLGMGLGASLGAGREGAGNGLVMRACFWGRNAPPVSLTGPGFRLQREDRV